jgi:hypothetical protein
MHFQSKVKKTLPYGNNSSFQRSFMKKIPVREHLGVHFL